MTKQELDEEIEFIHENRTKKELLRPLGAIHKVIVEATSTYTNLALFMNDYRQFYYDWKINENTFNSAMNDLYLLALYILAVRRS